MLLSPGLVTHWISLHHHLHQQHHLLLHPTLSKSKLIPFWVVTMPVFRPSLGFLESLSNSPLSVFGHLSRGPAYYLAIMRTIWSEWIQAGWPSWASLVLNAFGHFSWGPTYCLTVLRTIWSEWTRSWQSPWLAAKFHLESLFRTVHIYCILCIYCIFLSSDWIQFISFYSVKHSIQLLLF